MRARVQRCNDASCVLHASRYVVEWPGRLLSWLWLQDFDWRPENVGQWCIPQYFTAVGKRVLELELQRCGKEVDKMTLIGDGHPGTSGCICRACFRNFEKYGKLEATLAENMRKAIAILPTCSTATSTVARKRGSKDNEHGSGDKRPRMESAGADVGVSSKAKKLHPKVATSTSVSPAVAVSCMPQCLL